MWKAGVSALYQYSLPGANVESIQIFVTTKLLLAIQTENKTLPSVFSILP
jgi:hypothetical protein